jgi:dimethylargininase
MVSGLTDATLGIPNYSLACRQHDDYIAALQECGLVVTVLDALEEFPDSCFVEDAALMTPACAILTNPGAISRRGEVTHIEAAVRHFYQQVERIDAAGTVEAGDIMMVGDHYYIGLSARTNELGAAQMIALLEQHGMTGSMIEMSEMLHLKTGVNYLDNDKLLICGEFIGKSEFADFDHIEIDADNAYSANSVWINDTVLVPAGFPATVSAVEEAGYRVRQVDASEFQKLDGGLSCLSLRF